MTVFFCWQCVNSYSVWHLRPIQGHQCQTSLFFPSIQGREKRQKRKYFYKKKENELSHKKKKKKETHNFVY